jgi:prefoldin subunit 5
VTDKIKNLEDKIERLTRYIELVDKNISELREMIETRTEIDLVEKLLKRISRILKSKER